MKRKNKDGIVFDSTVYLLEENHRRFPVYMRLLQLLMVYLGGFCFMSIFINCLNLQFISSMVLTGIVVSGSVFYLLLLNTSFDYIKLLFVCLAYSGMIYYWFEQLKNGFYILENAIIEKASLYYQFHLFRFVADDITALEDMTFLLIIIIIPVEGLIALYLLRGKLTWLCYMFMLIPVVISFALGITPRESDMLAYILVFVFLYMSNGFIYKSSGKNQKSLVYRINVRSALIVCIIVFLLFNIIKLFVPLEKYENYDAIDTTKSNIQKYIMDFSLKNEDFFDVDWNIGSKRLTASGGLSNGELGRVDKVTYDETEHLVVSAPLNSVLEGIYLRGYVGSVYTGDSWEIHNRNTRKSYEDIRRNGLLEGYEPSIGNSLILNNKIFNLYTRQGRIRITYRNSNNDYAYAPYFTSFTKENEVEYEYDLGVIPKKNKTANTFDYSYNVSNLLENIMGLNLYDSEPEEYLAQEEKYREFVYDTYTRLPEVEFDRLKIDFSRERVGKQSENLWDAIGFVKEYLDKNTRYTLSPGRLPQGRDFVEYFIYDNKLGYCSHYASAGVLMLRAMGYPARYVEGYSINRSDFMDSIYFYVDEFDGGDSVVEVSVKDKNAHAWAEVYIDGFGWIPVEFTPASGMVDLADEFAGSNSLNQSETATPTITPPIPTKGPEEEMKPYEESINKSTEDGSEPDTNLKWYWFTVPIIISLAAFLIYRLYMFKKRNDYIEENHSRKALNLYKKIEKLFIFSKGLPGKSRSLENSEDYVKENLELVSINDFENCMDVVRKARFGKEEISLSEYMELKQFYDNLETQIYERTPRIKRILLRLIL